jgi:hypothetical protein
MCEDQFTSYMKKSKKRIDELIVIIDEADQILFNEYSSQMTEKELA